MYDEEKVIDILRTTKKPLKNQEITELGKLDRVTVNKILQKMEEEGKVNSPKKDFYVLLESSCMVDVAHCFINDFTQEKCCGKCAPCRVGTHHMLKMLTEFKNGNATIEDIGKLERLSHLIKKTSMCGLGQAAPDPVLDTLENFKEVYEAHINNQCPSMVCKTISNRESE